MNPFSELIGLGLSERTRVRSLEKVEDHIQPVLPCLSPIVLSVCPTASVTLPERATRTSQVNNKPIKYQCTHLNSFFLFHFLCEGNPFFASNFQHFLSHIGRLVHTHISLYMPHTHIIYIICIYVEKDTYLKLIVAMYT